MDEQGQLSNDIVRLRARVSQPPAYKQQLAERLMQVITLLPDQVKPAAFDAVE